MEKIYQLLLDQDVFRSEEEVLYETITYVYIQKEQMSETQKLTKSEN